MWLWCEYASDNIGWTRWKSSRAARRYKLIGVCHSFVSLFEYGVCQHNLVWRHFKRYIFFKTPFDLEDFLTWNQNCSKGRNNADVHLIALDDISWRTLVFPSWDSQPQETASLWKLIHSLCIAQDISQYIEIYITLIRWSHSLLTSILIEKWATVIFLIRMTFHLSWPGVHFSFDVLPSWVDQGSCAHKCVCQNF